MLTVGRQQRGAAAVDEDVVDYDQEGEGGEFPDEELLVLKVGEVLGYGQEDGIAGGDAAGGAEGRAAGEEDGGGADGDAEDGQQGGEGEGYAEKGDHAVATAETGKDGFPVAGDGGGAGEYQGVVGDVEEAGQGDG